MGRIHTCEALVLKTYDIGDADRFCIVLTDTQGRAAVRAKSVRKLRSKLASSLLSFQHIKLDLAEHSSGYYVRSASCLNSFPGVRTDLQKFTLASRASELLLHFLEDHDPVPEIFSLTQAYFELCHEAVESQHLFAFQILLLKYLGLLPSFSEDQTVSSSLRAFLESPELTYSLSGDDQKRLGVLCSELLQDHLSFPLKSSKIGKELCI